MTITFEDNNEGIIYALEKVIAYPRKTQQILVAQCVWWLASIIGLEEGLISHIDNLQSRVKVSVTSRQVPEQETAESEEEIKNQPDKVLEECEELLQSSRWLRRIARLKATGIMPSDQAKQSKIGKSVSRNLKD